MTDDMLKAAIKLGVQMAESEARRMLALKTQQVLANAKKGEMLTPSELASLRQDAKEASDYARKAFSHLRPKPTP
jgi:hypothetical protein